MLTDKQFSKNTKIEGNKYKVEQIYNFGGVIYGRIEHHNVYMTNGHGSCSCIENSYCKHLYALLLKYKSSKDIEDQVDKLDKLTKKEIIATIKKFLTNNLKVVSQIGEAFYENANDSTNIEQIMVQIEDCADFLSIFNEEEIYINGSLKYDQFELEKNKLNKLSDKLIELLRTNNITKNNDIINRLNKCNDKINDHNNTYFENIIEYLSK